MNRNKETRNKNKSNTAFLCKEQKHNCKSIERCTINLNYKIKQSTFKEVRELEIKY